ncbi:MAG: HDIG domain-containing protein [Parachlamydiales bacterium]|nr:HDIG domain-containing protein [Parachlamydiales bacterium]
MDKNSKEESKRLSMSLFFQRDVVMRLLIGLICWLGLFLFLHFREVRYKMLDLHATSGQYIIANVDFEFPDENQTVIFKQQVLKDIGIIYVVDGAQLRQVSYEFEHYILQGQEWKTLLPFSSYEELYKTADALENLLVQTHFTDARTIQTMKDLNISVANYLVLTKINHQQTMMLDLDYWKQVPEQSFHKSLREILPKIKDEVIDFVLTFYEKNPWSLVRDTEIELSVKKLIEQNIPQKFKRVSAGEVIIKPGEKITPHYVGMMQAMKKALEQQRKLWSPLTILGNMLMAFIFVMLSALYLYIDQRDVLRSSQKLSLIVCVVLLTLAFAKITEFILLNSGTNLLDVIQYPLIVPFAAILISILLNSRIALYSSLLLSIILAIALAFDHNRFLVVNLAASLIVIISSQSLRKRKEVFIVCGKCFIGVIPLILSFNFLSHHIWNTGVSLDMGAAFGFMLVTAILTMGLLPILESLFNVLTDITLMEYMDPNNELLRRLTLEIPGTYQHSLVLGNLAEAAAQSIGANSLLCRVATLYHDIGKLNNAHYFTENQQIGVNIHQLLTPAESAQIIISHIQDGVNLAKKYRLPQPFIDIIKEHHGTTLVYYFYCKELELKGGRVEEVDESQFRYPGPKPQSKESAIIMIVDAVEAGSRSLESISEESLKEMVNKIVKDKSNEGQFDESPLTFNDLSKIKSTVIRTLMVTHHVRVRYPEKA